LTDVTEAGVDGPGGQQRPARGPRARTVRLITIVLALVLVAALAVAIWLGLEARSHDQERKERAAAANVASQFALRMDSVDGENFEKYLKSITELMSTKAKTKNKQAFDAIRESYKTAKVKGEGKVLLTAVGDADEDSATVLVVHDQDVTTTQGKIEHHYRWSVNMVKVKDSWLVDDFNPVN
jgi:hypothetical protein